MLDTERMHRQVLFMADAHIRGRTWTNSLLLQGDSYTALEKIKDSVLLNTLVVGGDWFDSNRPSSADVTESQRFLSAFEKVYYIRGNHDNAEPAWIAGIRQDAVHLSETPEELAGGTLLYGIDWDSQQSATLDKLTQIAQDIRSNHADARAIIVMHDAVKEFLGFDGTYFADADTIGELLKGLKVTVLIGHVHKRDTIQLDTELNSCIHSPGSLYPAATDQMFSPSFVTLVDPVTGVLTSINCSVRLYAPVEWSDMARLESIAHSLYADNHLELTPCIRLQIPADVDVHIDPMQIPGVILSVSKNAPDAVEEHIVTSDTVVNDLRDAVAAAAAVDDDLKTMALELLASDDPLALLGYWLDYWKVTVAEGETHA